MHRSMPIFYVMYYPILLEVAKKHGYTLAVHGSVVRDFDLIAFPWITNPLPYLEMLEEMKSLAGDLLIKPKYFDTHSVKPLGRESFTISIGNGGYIDISIFIPEHLRTEVV